MAELLAALPARDRVARTLRDWIASGQLERGGGVPSERALALELGVSRDTVRVVLEDFTRQGLLAGGKARSRRIVAGIVPPLQSSTPSLSARPVVDLLSRTIALLTDWPISPDNFATMPAGFDSRVFVTAATALQDAGFHVLSLQPHRVTVEDVDGMAAQRLGGILLFGNAANTSLGQQLLEAAKAVSLPSAVYGDSPALASFDRCASDHEAGAYELTKLLLAQGKKRIIRFWRFEQDHPWLRCRSAGYERAMREAGLDPLPEVRTPNLPLNSETETGFQHTVRLLGGYVAELTAGPLAADAIMVATDPHAFEVGEAIKLIGRDPSQWPIVGYDNSYQQLPARRWSTITPFATADKDNSELGRQLAAVLLQRMQTGAGESPQRRMIKPQIIVCEQASNPSSV